MVKSNLRDFQRELMKLVKSTVDKSITDSFQLVRVNSITLDESSQFIRINCNSVTTPSSILHECKLMGEYLGNGKGKISIPEIDDFGLMLNIKGMKYYLGNVFDEYTSSTDLQPISKLNSFILKKKANGSSIEINELDNIVLKTGTGGKLALNSDDSIQLTNSNGYGITISSAGVVTIKSSSVNTTHDGGGDTIPITTT